MEYHLERDIAPLRDTRSHFLGRGGGGEGEISSFLTFNEFAAQLGKGFRRFSQVLGFFYLSDGDEDIRSLRLV